MNKRLLDLHREIASILNGLADVFSTPQWGGRAYKLPGPGGSRTRPKLLAFVAPNREETAIGVSFKLPKVRAADLVEKHDWLAPHSFRTLRGSGWLSAQVRTKRQLAVLARLLAESRELHPAAEPEPAPKRTRVKAGSNPDVRRIDRVMEEMRANGWRPGG